MSDFPDEEPDPEMAEDHEENGPGLVELLSMIPNKQVPRFSQVHQ